MLSELTDATSVLEHAAEAVFVTDAGLRIVWVNEAAHRLLGHTRDQLLARNAAELVASRDPRVLRLHAGALRTGRPLVTVERLLHADGSHVVCELSASRLPDGRIVALARNLRRYDTPADRGRSEDSFRSLAEKLPDAIAIHRDGRFVFCNRALLQTLGYDTQEELVGTPVIEVVHPDSRPVVAERLAALAAGKLELPWLEEQILRRDGSSLTMEISSLKIVFQGAPAFAVVARDVTERNRLQARLALADRMASIGTLAAGIGHEINNPLTYVALNLETARRLVAGRDHLTRVDLQALDDLLLASIEGASRVRDIVSGLRRFARADQPTSGSAQVGRALDAALELMGHQLRLRARLVRDVRACPAVPVHEGRLTQVFVNLLANALQAIPEGHADSNEIAIRCWSDDHEVRVAVTDTGAGIPADKLARIFEPFFTTKAPGAGTGLGLAICHGIVTSSGGRIEATSQIGHGTTITVILPIVPPAAEPPAPQPEATPAPAPAPRTRILLVDDERAILTAISTVLRDEEYEVEEATSGSAAIAKLAAGLEVDLILCDLTMPDVTGADVFRWVEQHRPALTNRMVFTSGGSGHELATRFPERWLDKPFSADRLLHVLGERLAATRTPRH